MKKLIVIVAAVLLMASCASIPPKKGKIANWKDMREGTITKRHMLNGMPMTSFNPLLNTYPTLDIYGW